MSPEHRHARVIIIGGGPAGYTAAIYAARALLEPLLLAGPEPGGQLTITTDVENYPGFADAIQGPWLMEQMQAQAKRAGTIVVSDIVTDVDFTQKPFHLRGDMGAKYTAKTVIVATGAKAKWLNLPSEETFKGYGVSACATCDGFFYRDKEVLVIGGGNTAVEEALFLTRFAKRVTLVHRRDALRAEQILQKRLMSHDKIEVLWDTVLEEVLGNADPSGPPGVTGARLCNVRTGTQFEYPADGIFIAIGHAPATDVFTEHLKTHNGGYIFTEPDSTATSVPGVFAAGDVTDYTYRQAVTAAGMGCMAALEAERYLAENGTGGAGGAKATQNGSAKPAQ